MSRPGCDPNQTNARDGDGEGLVVGDTVAADTCVAGQGGGATLTGSSSEADAISGIGAIRPGSKKAAAAVLEPMRPLQARREEPPSQSQSDAEQHTEVDVHGSSGPNTEQILLRVEAGLPAGQPMPAASRNGLSCTLRWSRSGLQKMVVRRPVCLIIALQFTMLLLCICCFKGGKLNTEMDSFARAYSNQSLYYDAFKHAWDYELAPPSSQGNSSFQAVNSSNETNRPRMEMNIGVYVSVYLMYHCEGCNILSEENLITVREYEAGLRGLPGWIATCHDPLTPQNPGRYQTCGNGETLLNYVWPEELPEATKGEFVHAYSGCSCAGTELSMQLHGQDSREACRLACLAAGGDGCSKFVFAKTDEGGSCWWDYGGSCSDQRSSLSGSFECDTYVRVVASPFHSAEFRSSALEFNGAGFSRLPMTFSLSALEAHNRLRLVLPKDFSIPQQGEEANSSILRSRLTFARAGFKANVLSVLKKPNKELQKHGINLYYTSSTIARIQLMEAVMNDVLLAVGGIFVVIVVVRLHTRSTPLTLFAIFIIVECLPVGFSLFQQFSGSEDVGLVNCVSLFVIIGIGADLIFVLYDGWVATRERLDRPVLGEDPEAEERRLLACISQLFSHSGLSCTTTTLCAASSFLVNLGSVLGALREFGLFMGLCILCSLAFMVTMFPLALLAVEKRRRKAMIPAGVGSAPTRSSSTDGCTTAGPSEADGADGQLQGDQLENGTFSQMMQPRLGANCTLHHFFKALLPNFLERHSFRVVIAFLCAALAGTIGTVATIKMDPSLPELLPESHIQMRSERLATEFSSSKSEDGPLAWKCPLTTPSVEDNCTDSISYCEPSDCQTSEGEQSCRRTCGLCSSCVALWCRVEEAPKAAVQQEEGRCECFQKDGDRLDGSRVRAVQTTFVGLDSREWTQMSDSFAVGLHVETWAPMLEQVDGDCMNDSSNCSGRERPSLWQQHWRSGSAVALPVFDGPLFAARGVLNPEEHLTVRQYCYCGGVARCVETGMRSMAFNYTRSEGRQLQEAANDATHRNEQDAKPLVMRGPRRLNLLTASRGRPKVQVVWGLTVRELGPFEIFVKTDVEKRWEFDPMFDLADPWAQRSMLRLTENTPASLRVDEDKPVHTWLHAFEGFLRERGSHFPSTSFDSDLADFLEGSGDHSNFILDPDSGRVLATFVEFRLDVSKSSLPTKILRVKDAWDEYLEQCNVDASITAKGAWHTSGLWVLAEAQIGIVTSTASSIGISVMVGFLSAAIFTKSLWLAALAMVSIVLTIITMLFAMSCLAGWALGPVEALALIVFLGYMFTFNLHVVHAYSHLPAEEQEVIFQRKSELLDREEDSHVSSMVAPRGRSAILAKIIKEERIQRVRFAITAMGRSLLGSSVTTLSCALFLIFCTLRFFVTFGWVILLVTTTSLVYSLVFLPALLVILGPTSMNCIGCLAARDRVLQRVKSMMSGEESLPGDQSCVHPEAEADELYDEESVEEAEDSEASDLAHPPWEDGADRWA